MATTRLIAPRLRLLVFVCLGVGASGCGSGFKTVPVSGKLLLNGVPLTDVDATIMFRPDASKGNTLSLDFAGTVDEEGNYSLHYGNGNSGAAPGWYKVAVVAMEPLQPKRPPTPEERKKIRPGPSAHVRKSLIDEKYKFPTSSGIEIEVVESPAANAYDLNLLGPAKK
jgi:hypothetical protein